MSIEIKIPDLGHDDGVEVIEVLVAAGDQIEKDDPLITIESDKATFEVPAEEAGTIAELKVSLGDEVKTGTVIATIEPGDADDDESDDKSNDGKNDEEASDTDSNDSHDSDSDDSNSSSDDNDDKKDAEKNAKDDSSSDGDNDDGDADNDNDKQSSSSKEQQSKKKSKTESKSSKDSNASQTSNTQSSNNSSVNASPKVRKAARELGVDLHEVTPANDDGRITLDDVKAFVREQYSELDKSAAPAKENPERYGDVERTELTKIRAMTAAIMHKSWLEAPQVTHFDEVNITELDDYRRRLNISFLPLLIKAVANTLEDFPLMRSSIDIASAELVQKNYCRIGIAVDTDDGLLRPVLADVDEQNIAELSANFKQLVNKARAGRLAPTEQRGGVFTISSLGGMGGTQFTPIVNGPEVGILGVSKTQVKPIYVDGEFKPASFLPLALSYDHRVIDGVYAAKFMNSLKERLEGMADLLA